MRLFRRRADRDFADEIEAHIALEAERLRADGVPEAEARSRASRAFGNTAAARERFYESRRAPALDAFTRDLRYALRGLRRNPGFAAAAILTLALGVGANTAIFSAVDEVLFRPPDLPHAGRLANVYRVQRKTAKYLSSSYPDYDDFRRQARSFQDLAAYARLALTVDWGGGAVERTAVEAVSGNYFDTLGAPMLGGHAFTAADDAPGAAPVAIISEDLWRNRFHADASVIGQSVRVADSRFTIVGVAPASVSGLNLNWLTPPKVWVPLRTAGLLVPRMAELKIFDHRSMIWLVLVGRLRPDASAASAQSELQSIAARIPGGSDLTAAVMPLSRSKFWPSYRDDVGRSLGAFAVAAGLILLLACANVSNLLLGRAMRRRREIAVRLAIGAGRRHLARQLLIESSVLAVLSCGAAVGLASLLMRLLRQFPDALGLPLALDLQLEPRALAFCAAASLLTIALCGFAPALWTARLDVAASLKRDGSAAGVSQVWVRGALVALQAAFSMMLLVGGGLYGRTLWKAYATDLGFRAGDLLTASFSLPAPGSDHAARAADAQQALLRELPSLPGVVSATLSSTGLLSRVQPIAQIAGGPNERAISAGYELVARDYLRTMQIRLVAGRDFTARDEAASSANAIVNTALADALGSAGAVGRTLRIDSAGRRKEYTIVGIAADARYRSIWEQPQPHVYLAAGASDVAAGFLLVRTSAPPQTLAEPLRSLWTRLSPAAPLYDVRTGADAVALSLTPQRVAAGILGGFGALSILLTGVGLYSVISFLLQQQTREIGIRIAIGAAPGTVVASIVRRALAWVAAGLAGGAAASALAGRALTANTMDVSR